MKERVNITPAETALILFNGMLDNIKGNQQVRMGETGVLVNSQKSANRFATSLLIWTEYGTSHVGLIQKAYNQLIK